MFLKHTLPLPATLDRQRLNCLSASVLQLVPLMPLGPVLPRGGALGACTRVSLFPQILITTHYVTVLKSVAPSVRADCAILLPWAAAKQHVSARRKP